MKISITPTKVILFGVALAALVACAPASGTSHATDPNLVSGDEEEGAELFTDVPDPTQVQAASHERPYRQRRTVKVDVPGLRKIMSGAAEAARNSAPGQTLKKLRLNLFGNTSVLVAIKAAQAVSQTNVVVTGEIEGEEESSATLVVKDNVFVGNVRLGSREEEFEIRYVGSEVHSITDIEPQDVEDCATDDSMAMASAMADAGTEGEVSIMANPVIRILVAYTPNARYRQGGTSAIQALIQMGIADTNAAFANSGVAASVYLAGTMELTQNETTSFSNDLSSLRGKTDGRWDSVHARRASVKADQVTLVGAYASSSSTAGIGYIGGSAAYAFTVVKASMFGQYTFSHELGHNFGLNHSDGYSNSTGRFRTIMAYGTYTRVRRFSNPSYTYNGYRTGDSDQNSAKKLNANASRMASHVL